MKILFYNHTGRISGAERVLIQIVTRLDHARFQPVVMCPQGALMTELQSADVKTREAPELNARFTYRPDQLVRYIWSVLQALGSFRKHVRSEQPGLIHANSVRAGIVATLATIGTGVKVLWHVHDVLPRHPLSIAIKLLACFSRRTALAVVSEAVANRFCLAALPRSFRENRISLLRNCVDADRYKPERDARERKRRELALNDVPLIGIIGQLTPRKGQLELIEAFDKARLLAADAILLVIGSPVFDHDKEYEQMLLEAVRERGLEKSVRFLGHRADIPELMQALDVLVVNSREEPFGLVVLEGMASGTPIIATRVGGTPEMVEHGIDGWLVSAGDRARLTNALLELLEKPDLRDSLAASARRRVIREFNPLLYMRRLEQIYLNYKAPLEVANASKELNFEN